MKKNTIWDNILLQSVYGSELKNTTTISKDEKSSGHKYQVFEILIVETLALLDSSTKWQATFGSNDRGVDIIGTKNSLCTTPFVNNTPQQLFLGQIKRRNSGYRYEDFRTDINKLFEYYSSEVLYKNSTLMQLIFVISSDNANNTENLRQNLLKDFDTKEHLLFIAGIKSPIAIIDALDIIKYWKLNFDFVKNIIDGIFSEQQLEEFKKFLDDIEFSGISFSIQQDKTTCLGKIQELRIKLTADLKDIPLDIYLKWIPDKISLGNIQLISPWTLCENKGLYAHIENTYELLILFRGVSVGNQRIGELEVSYPNTSHKQKIPLGNIYVQKNFFPIYWESPNQKIKLALEKSLFDKKCKFYPFAILGCGGIGKSALLSEIAIKAVNNSFFCIDIRYSHNFTSGNNFLIQLLTKIISQSVHKMILTEEIIIYIKSFLGGLYKEEWDEALNDLVQGKKIQIGYICDCIVSLFIKLTYKTPCMLWISDMHWLNSINAELLRKVYFSLKNNQNYINNNLIIFFEGRNNEMLMVDNKYYIPYVWEDFLKETDIEQKELLQWDIDECNEFLNMLFDHHQINCNGEFLECMKMDLLRITNGVPMHILEQIKFLIEQKKIILKDNGDLYIFEPNWAHLLSDDLKELVNLRIQYYYQKNENIMDFLAIYAQLNLHLIPACAKYVYKFLSRKFSDYINVLKNISFIKIENDIIYFQHEYYSEVLKKSPIKSEDSITIILNWFINKGNLTDYEFLCKLNLLQMYLFIDYDELCLEIVAFLKYTTDEYMKQQAYEMLLEIPSDILKKNNLFSYKIRYELCESIIITGNWKSAKKHFLKIVDSINCKGIYEIYYGALAYQDLSNISSGELLLDESIAYANKGIHLIDTTIHQFDDQNSYDLLMQAKDMLMERLAICYAFSGHLDKAIALQEQAYASASSRNDTYMMLRIHYEQGGVSLHIDLDNAVEILTTCYKEASVEKMMFSEEEALIKTMELLGKTKQIYLSNSIDQLDDVYREAVLLIENQQKKNHNYSASIHLITMAALVLLKENNVQKALAYLFKSLERALDSHLNELLWKSYINIAQLKEYMNHHDEAEYYARKAKEILVDMINQNPKNQETILSLVSVPLEYLEKILGCEMAILKKKNVQSNGMKIHSFVWKSIQLFVMN